MAVKFIIAVVFFICLFMTLESRSVSKVSSWVRCCSCISFSNWKRITLTAVENIRNKCYFLLLSIPPLLTKQLSQWLGLFSIAMACLYGCFYQSTIDTGISVPLLSQTRVFVPEETLRNSKKRTLRSNNSVNSTLEAESWLDNLTPPRKVKLTFSGVRALFSLLLSMPQ